MLFESEDRRWSEWRREWPERAALTASVAGLIGVLLVSLLIAAEVWSPTVSDAPVLARTERAAPSRAAR